MPQKVRILKARLAKAGFICRSGKGSHTVWDHPLLPDPVIVSGNNGDDAKPYQALEVEKALKKLGGKRR